MMIISRHLMTIGKNQQDNTKYDILMADDQRLTTNNKQLITDEK